MTGLIKECLLFLVPRFTTDRVALFDDGGEWQVLCLEGKEIEGDEELNLVYGTLETFTWFGFTKGGMVELDD